MHLPLEPQCLRKVLTVRARENTAGSGQREPPRRSASYRGIGVPGEGERGSSDLCCLSGQVKLGGTSTLQAAMPGKLKSPPLGTLKWVGVGAWLPEKSKSHPLQAQHKSGGFTLA